MLSALFKKEVGPYVLGKLIGTGATSTVHLGEHKDTKKLVPPALSWYCGKLRMSDAAPPGGHQDGKAHAQESITRQCFSARGDDAGGGYYSPLTLRQVNALKQLSHNNLLRLESIFRDDEHDCMCASATPRAHTPFI